MIDTDHTYYRGYRLEFAGNSTQIWYGTDHIDTAANLTAAMAVIDDWMNAR